MPKKEPFCLDSETRTHSAWSQTTNATIKHHIQKREFDRIRTCVDKCHKLAPKPLGHKLHIVAPEGVEPSPTEPKPVVLPLYHRAMLVTRERFELPTPTFVASYSNPAELTSLVSSFWVQRYNRQMKPFFVAEKKFGLFCLFRILLLLLHPNKHQECFNAHQPSLRYATVVKGCELSEY